MVNENDTNNDDQSRNIMINSNSLESVPSINGDVRTDKYFICVYSFCQHMKCTKHSVIKNTLILFSIYFSRMAHDPSLYQVFIQQPPIRQQYKRMKSSRVNWKIPIEILHT